VKKFFTAIEENDVKTVKNYLGMKTVHPDTLFETNLYENTFTWSGLHAAAYYGFKPIISLLVEHGANVELEDTWYRGRPLAWAAFGGKMSPGSGFGRMNIVELIDEETKWLK
jgi:ankyrin repeat protein